MGVLLGQPPVMSVTEKYVYVIYGGTLYQYSTDGLKLLANASLLDQAMANFRNVMMQMMRAGGGGGNPAGGPVPPPGAPGGGPAAPPPPGQ